MSKEPSQQSSGALAKATQGFSRDKVSDESLKAIHEAAKSRRKSAERPVKPVSSIDGKGMGLSLPRHDRRSWATMDQHATYEERLARELAYNKGVQDKKDAERRIALWRESGVPKRHAAKAGHFDDPVAWAVTRNGLMCDLGTGFLLGFLGGRGPGKTQMAVDIVQQGCEELRTCRYAKAMDFFLDVRATYGTEHSERGVIDAYVKYDLLVLDEVGVQAETPFEDRLLVHLIDKRYDAMKDTILISNLLPEEFAKSVGKSIHERLKETGEITIFYWPSFRKPAKPAEVAG